MQITPHSRLLLRTETLVFVVLLVAAVALLAWLSERYKRQWDWTAAGRNTLSQASEALLDGLSGPIEIVAFAREEPLLRQSIQQLIERYQRHNHDISLRFVNPDLVPDQVRDMHITVDGELVVSYRQRREHAKALTERALSTALEKLARDDTRWIANLAGHGERSLLGQANHDLGRLGEELEKRGFKVSELILVEAGEVPANATMLVISQAQVDLLPEEVSAVERYLEGGGNLLWLADPGPRRGLQPVARLLGLSFQAGTVVDPGTRMLGIQHPAFVPITGYSNHPLTEEFRLVTVFPYATAISWRAPEGWETRGILSTGLRAWSETSALEGEIGFDDGIEPAGPLDIGIAMRRTLVAKADDAGVDSPAANVDDKEQRVVVIGDGDFLSNTYLGSGGNLDLALNIFNWLAADDVLINIPARSAPDIDFELSRAVAVFIGFAVLMVLPGIFLGTGVLIWHRRRRR